MSVVAIPIKVLPHGIGLPLPDYASAHAAGCDLVAALPAAAPITVAPGERALIATGIALGLPENFEAQVRPRSGLALRYGITVLNAPGTIDADYRGEVFVLLANFGHEVVVIERGMRIAQMVFAPVSRARFVVANDLEPTLRDAGGFGSTGLEAKPVVVEPATS